MDTPNSLNNFYFIYLCLNSFSVQVHSLPHVTEGKVTSASYPRRVIWDIPAKLRTLLSLTTVFSQWGISRISGQWHAKRSLGGYLTILSLNFSLNTAKYGTWNDCIFPITRLREKGKTKMAAEMWTMPERYTCSGLLLCNIPFLSLFQSHWEKNLVCYVQYMAFNWYKLVTQ